MDKLWMGVAGLIACLGGVAILWAEHIIRSEARSHLFDRVAALRVVWPEYLGLGVLGLCLVFVVPIPFLILAVEARRQRSQEFSNARERASNQQVQPIAGKPGSG